MARYVIDSTVSFGTGLPEPKPFPYWVLLGIPLLFIPLMKKKKVEKRSKARTKI